MSEAWKKFQVRRGHSTLLYKQEREREIFFNTILIIITTPTFTFKHFKTRYEMHMKSTFFPFTSNEAI